MAYFDFVINGGDVVDGTGTPRSRLNVGVAEGRIAAVSSQTLRGRRTVDASGLVVVPGFIDLHSHADYTLPGSPAATTQIHQGVTTVVTGNCGHSPFPVDDVDLLRRSGIIDDASLDWSWSDAAGFGAAVDAAQPAVNVGLQVGHNAIRLAAVGEDDREPTAAESEQMARAVTTAAEQGVLGFSTGLIYAPGMYATPEEVRALVAAAAHTGVLYSTHVRNEAEDLLSAIREAIDAAERSAARLEISHLKAMGPRNHGSVVAALDLIDDARTRGVDVAADVYPYTASSTSLVSRIPSWAQDGGKDALLARLADPGTRRTIADQVASRFGAGTDPDRLIIAEVPDSYDQSSVGRSLVELGRADGTDPAEAALRLLESCEGNVTIVNHGMAEEDVTTVLRHPMVSVASDGWIMTTEDPGRPHPRSFGTFARVLGRYVRERNVLTLEEAVRKMTSLPASRLGLTRRGVISEGNAADIAVFDPDAVLDNATFEEPRRLATGCSAVFVNGVPAMLDGATTGLAGGGVIGSRGMR